MKNIFRILIYYSVFIFYIVNLYIVNIIDIIPKIYWHNRKNLLFLCLFFSLDRNWYIYFFLWIFFFPLSKYNIRIILFLIENFEIVRKIHPITNVHTSQLLSFLDVWSKFNSIHGIRVVTDRSRRIKALRVTNNIHYTNKNKRDRIRYKYR